MVKSAVNGVSSRDEVVDYGEKTAIRGGPNTKVW